MAGTGHGSGKRPTRRAATPRTGAVRTGARGTGARPGAGPGRSRATASGAARKANAAQVATERRTSRGVLRVVVLASIAVLLAVTLVPTLRSYLRQQGEIESLHQKVAQQRTDVAQLQREQARWNDDAYVMQQARERLKFVKVGEKSYTVIDPKPDGKSLTGGGVPTTSGPDQPWYGQLWQSVRAADASPAADGPPAAK